MHENIIEKMLTIVLKNVPLFIVEMEDKIAVRYVMMVKKIEQV
jgi:hypothetical protein